MDMSNSILETSLPWSHSPFTLLDLVMVVGKGYPGAKTPQSGKADVTVKLFVLCLEENLISVSELDPLGLHLSHHTGHHSIARPLGFKAPGHDVVIQVALIAETTRCVCVCICICCT